MSYIETPIKNNKKQIAKTEAVNLLSKQSTGSMIWFVVKRHKFFLVATYALWMTAIYIMPALPGLLSELLRIR